jgi:hypothetical protein
VIETGASVALSPSGGLASAEIKDYNFGNLIRIGYAKSIVSGSLESDGSFNTLSTVIMRGVDVQGIFTADEMVMRLTVHHVPDEACPSLRISPVGCSMTGVKIAGVGVQVMGPGRDPDGIHTDILSAFKAEEFPGCSKEEIAELTADYQKQTPQTGIANSRRAAISFLARKYQKSYNFHPYGSYALVGSVFQVDPKGAFRIGKHGDNLAANEFYVPNFGKIILGNYIVNDRRQRVSLVRMELGSPDEGNPDMGGGGSGGHGHPP